MPLATSPLPSTHLPEQVVPEWPCVIAIRGARPLKGNVFNEHVVDPGLVQHVELELMPAALDLNPHTLGQQLRLLVLDQVLTTVCVPGPGGITAACLRPEFTVSSR